MQNVGTETFEASSPTMWAGSRSPLRIVQLCGEHEAQLSRLLRSLDRCSRINRFGHPANDSCLDAYARQALSTGAFTAGAFVGDTLVGVVEVFKGANEGTGEAAFIVNADWRRLGLGTALLERAREWAGQSGVSVLQMIMARNNWPMRHLANKAGARFDLELDEIRADIILA